MSEPTPTAGVVVFDDQDRVLMVMPGETSKHERGVLGLPAGRLDEGEGLLACAVRECEEETGVLLDPDDLVQLPETYTAVLDRRDGSTELMTWTVFATAAFSGQPRTSLETEPVWVPRAELSERRLQKNVAAAVQQAAEALNLA